MNVRLKKDQKIKILNSEDIFKIMQQILLRESKIGRNQEHFWVVGLNNKNKILFIELIGLGTVNRVNANPPDVFRMGIYKLAVKMMLVHNHPTGSLKLSKSDKDFTDRMLKVGKLINIEVVDHLVITEDSYVSFEDDGVMDELRNSGLFEIVKREQEEIKAWKLAMEKERAMKERSIEIAKMMKADGQDIETIKKYTGLKKGELEKL